MNTGNNGKGFADIALRVFAIIGIIVLIPLILWASVAVARMVPTAFSAVASAIVSVTSVFVAADESITISLPSLTVKDSVPFTLTWEHEQKKNNGMYTFRYACTEGVTFTLPTVAGATTNIACDTRASFVGSDTSVVVTPNSTENRFVDVPVFIEFTPEGLAAPTVSAGTIVTIENTTITGSPSTGGNGTGTTPRTPTRGTETTDVDVFGVTGPIASDPNGRVDLSVRFLELGVVDKATGVFTASSTPSRSEITSRVAARFAVENIGTKTSDQWTFNAVLPTYPSHIYSSPTQPELAPGDRVEFTLGFDSFEEDNEGVLVINADPVNRINESNKTNNILRHTIIITD